MAFSASRREWSELCAFFYLLNRGKVTLGNAEGKASVRELPIAVIQREEHNGTRRYYIHENEIHITGEGVDCHFIREDFGTVADLVSETMKQSHEDEVESPDGVEEFLDELGIFNLEAKTEDRTDLHLGFYSTDAPLIGFRIYAKMGGMDPLMDGGRAANIKFEQVGVRFPNPTVNKINAIETDNEVLDRIGMIERLGGQLKFNDAADKIFRSNLNMIDLHFPRVLGEMARLLFLEDINRVSDLTERIKEINPLKIKDELIRKHGYYEYKMKEFLLSLANGMRPAKLYNGTESAVGGFLLMNPDGEILCYYKGERQVFADFLYNNTRFLKGNLQKDHYGYLERENGLYYFKLNFKVAFVKR